MDICFFAALIIYFLASVIQFVASAMKKDGLHKIARVVFLAGIVLHTAYTVWRGIVAGRLPLANQFEFASGFAWAIVVLGFSYAAFQPMQIKDIMPALRSTWFALHIGSAAFSYASFAISAGLGVGYLVQLKKGKSADDPRMKQMDYLGYRVICLGFLLLTVVIFSGAIWAEQAWSSWWSWDPKETWALITWIFYAIYLHQRLRLKWQGKRMAWLAIIAFILVIFTFAGVNLLLPGLHSYATT